jgi:hypothetical protein
MSNGSFVNYATSVAPNTVIQRLKKKSVKGDPDQET